MFCFIQRILGTSSSFRTTKLSSPFKKTIFSNTKAAPFHKIKITTPSPKRIYPYLCAKSNGTIMANKKERVNVVYSTNPNYQYEYENEEETATLPPERQNLKVVIDKKQRKGKTVTLVQGFAGSEKDLKALASHLKNKCGTGGSVKEGEIVIQGELREKVLNLLKEQGYRAK